MLRTTSWCQSRTLRIRIDRHSCRLLSELFIISKQAVKGLTSVRSYLELLQMGDDEDTKSIRSTKSSKSKKDDKGGIEDDEDERLDFILAYFTKSYRLKQERWSKMMAIEENKVFDLQMSLLYSTTSF
jgi:hypothetical protein